MEKWTYTKYSRPYLDIESAHVFDNKIVIKSPEDNFDIEFSFNKNRLIEIKSLLDNLCIPSHSSWSKIKENENNVISDLLTALDEKSLIINNDDIMQIIENQISMLECQIDKTVKLLTDEVTKNPTLMNEYLPLLINSSAYQLKLVCEEMGIILPFQWLPQNDLECVDNFFITTILYQIRYLKKSHPLALLIWFVSLCRLNNMSPVGIYRIEDFINLYWKEVALNWLGGSFNMREIAIYQACLFSHLMDSTREDAMPIFTVENIEANFSTPLSGINFMIKIERIMNTLLEKRGESLLYKKINGELDANSPLVCGIFIEQYHVNRRFVEIISPLLNKRFTDPLRKRVFQYYREEEGHEEFELKTCLSLGINEIDLINAFPLPLMQAYIDAFTVVADYDPIGFFSSAMITEGMIGDPSSLYDLLERIMADNHKYQRVARAHDNLNVDLNHAYLSRLFMGDVEVMMQASQQRAIKHVLYLFELNHRSLDQMAKYYSNQQTLTFYQGTPKESF